MLSNFSNDPQLPSHPLYQPVMQVLERLDSQNFFSFSAGHCWAISDVIVNSLAAIGIDANIAECEGLLLDDHATAFTAIGLQSNLTHSVDNSQIPTHIVVIVPHDQGSLLIDASISHLLPNGKNLVFGIMNADDPTVLGRFSDQNWTITYRMKLGLKLPAIHHLNMKQRINKDQQMDRLLKKLKASIAFSFFCLIIVGVLMYNNYQLISDARERASRNNELITLIIDRLNHQDERMNDIVSRMIMVDNERKRSNTDRDKIDAEQNARINDLNETVKRQSKFLADHITLHDSKSVGK